MPGIETSWTASQLAAKTADGISLLVSAAAGSGKTAVLAERCAHLVCDAKEPCDIDELLVVTFTEAAAAEMRGRIQAAIRRRLESFASPTPRLTRQLALVEHASISTIHGFCSRLIRQNFNAAGVDPNFSVIDGDEAMLLRGEIVRQLFDDAYEHDGTGKFQEFIDAYGDGNDQRLADLVTSGYELICSLDRPGQWLRSALDAISESAAQPLAKSKLGQRHLDEVRQWLDRLSANCAAAIKSISSLGAFRPYIDRLREYSAVIAEWKSTFDRRGYDELVAAFQRFDPDRLPGVSSTTPNKDRAKQSVDSIKGQMCGPEIARLLNFNESEWREGQKAIGPHVQIFLNLLGGFERRYKEAKASLRSLDYSDLERKALELLREPDAREPSAIARLCHREFKYVCVDEYQDVNEIQDAILNLVSTECVAGEGHYRPNLFAVGDVKQSIYRFRLAEPQRFLERMRLFRKAGAIGQVIDLQENFRSRPPLLEAINQVFLRLMTKEAAEIDYRDGHQLNPAPQPQFPAGGLKGAPIELHILPSQRPADEDEPTDMVAVDYEAMLCAQRIEKLVEKKVLIADNGVLRPARYGDVVVLLRAMKHKAQAFATTFRKRGIPVHYDGGSGFFDAREICDMIALLNILDNQRQDVPLAAILRSPLARLPKPEAAMARIRLQYPAPLPFHDAAFRYASERNDDLSAQLNRLLKQLGTWRDLAGQRPLADLIWTIYEQTGYLAYVTGLSDGAQRAANLIYLHQRARDFGSFLKQGLHRFMSFLHRLSEEGDLSLPSIASGQEDVVRIMSIHAAKGQQFSVVIVPDLGKRINFSDCNGSIILDRQSGLGFKVIDPVRRIRYPSLSWLLTNTSLRRQTLAEEMRLLYVAMTRAKEHLILIGTAKASAADDWTKQWSDVKGPMPADEILSAGNMLDWLGPAAAACGDSFMRIRSYKEEDFKAWRNPPGRDGVPVVPKNLVDFQPLAISPPVSQDAATVLARFDSTYPHQKYTHLEAATSATALKSATGVAEALELSLPAFLSSHRPPASAAEIGTATHLLLEHLDFSRPCDLPDIEAQSAGLIERGRMTAAQAAVVDRASILWLLATPLGALIRLRHADVRRELAFAAARATESSDPADAVMLRGRIDLIVPTDAGLAIVDYKTDRVTAQTVQQRAAEYNHQIAAYRDALERVAGMKVAAVYLVFLHPRILWRSDQDGSKIQEL